MTKKRITDRVVERVIKCKTSDIADLKVNEIARHLNVTVSHLSRAFKNSMKICLHEYIQKEKIKRACFLLKQNHRLTVKEVSRIMNFCSCDYFIQVFKKHIGTTPGKFRKMDKGFYGLFDRRKGQVERRSGLLDRRSGSSYGKSNLALSVNTGIQFPHNKNRRRGPWNRRKGPIDRRQVFHQTKSKL